MPRNPKMLYALAALTAIILFFVNGYMDRGFFHAATSLTLTNPLLLIFSASLAFAFVLDHAVGYLKDNPNNGHNPVVVAESVELYALGFAGAVIFMLAGNLAGHLNAFENLTMILTVFMALFLFVIHWGVIASFVGINHGRRLLDQAQNESRTTLPVWVFPVVFLLICFVLSRCGSGGHQTPAVNQQQQQGQQQTAPGAITIGNGTNQQPIGAQPGAIPAPQPIQVVIGNGQNTTAPAAPQAPAPQAAANNTGITIGNGQ